MSDDLQDFRAARDRYARGPRGPLALVNAQRVDVAQPVWPVPGEWAPATGGLTVTADPDDGVLVDDVLVDGTVLAAGDTAVVPSSIRFADGKAATIVGSTLRVWDPDSEPIERFGRIATFDHSDRWILQGRYTPLADADLEAPPAVADAAGDPLPVAGRVTASVEGVEHTFLLVRAGVVGGVQQLQLIFQDATGSLPEEDPHSSYSMGRFLFVDDPGDAADVVLDFNRAVLPPCAFSYQYACPIPPAENRLLVEVRAGERHPLATDGSVLH